MEGLLNHMKKPLTLAFYCSLLFMNSESLLANTMTVEESRITKAENTLQATATKYDQLIHSFADKLNVSDTSHQKKIIDAFAHQLWQQARKDIQSENSDYDDRALYWARLKLSKIIKEHTNNKQPILWDMERASRGQLDVNFSKKSTIKVLITGFDPFFLDKDIEQSNPSGLAALMLDGKTFTLADNIIEIQSVIFPVRFIDFDHGEVEKFLKPYLQKDAIDMLVTISMGRADFDLERFPGLRRSADAPDNLNVFTKASKQNPLIPKLGDGLLNGPEFVEFSLPVKAMVQIQEPFKVIDNTKVTTRLKTFHAGSLKELVEQTSVSGSGGGYLSNEISYRSINLANKLASKVSIGHLHTPRVSGFEPNIEKQIVTQIEKIILAGAQSLK